MEYISKKEVLDFLATIQQEIEDGYGFDYKVWKRNVEGLPTVEIADRPQGEWIYNGNFCGLNHHKCSLCGEEEFRMSDYCPNCGADMRGEDND